VATRTTKAGFDDKAALNGFAAAVGCVTYEFENVPVAAAEHLSGLIAVRPGVTALHVAQDRLTEKEFISRLHIPVAPFAAVESVETLRRSLAQVGVPAILKTRRLGYDGKGQVSVARESEAASAWSAIGAQPAVLEKRVTFALELSVLVVRSQGGEVGFYDCPVNTHEGGILRRSVVPAGIPASDIARAREIAASIAGALGYVGVLAVEMFYVPGAGDAREGLIVNEIAPRVHNSGHWTMDACAVSQFENHIRAVAGWPLGSTARHSDAEMINLIGKDALDWAKLAALPDACLHLYGKREARAGRKMGHITRLFPVA
jgi:5-(carboxyamino)imidazole ribonucleotide synthase